MEVQGKVVAVLPQQAFTSKSGNEMVRFAFVIETFEKYAKKIKFDVLGADKWQAMNVQAGASVSVSFDVSSREWNEKWFTQCDAWKVTSIGGNNVVTQPQAPQAQTMPQATNVAPQAPKAEVVQPQAPQGGNDLPF